MYINELITSVLNRDEWLASRPGRFIAKGLLVSIRLNAGWDPQFVSTQCAEQKRLLPLTGIESLFLGGLVRSIVRTRPTVP
jgi:hypothetical protein